MNTTSVELSRREAMIEGAMAITEPSMSMFIDRERMGQWAIEQVKQRGYTWGTCPECGGKGDYHTLCDEHGQCGADCENPDPLSVPCISNLCLACKGHGKGWFKADMEVDNG